MPAPRAQPAVVRVNDDAISMGHSRSTAAGRPARADMGFEDGVQPEARPVRMNVPLAQFHAVSTYSRTAAVTSAPAVAMVDVFV